jgi:hypothetical protein
MKEQLLLLFCGCILGYSGALLQHLLESKRRKASEIRLEKMRIYSNVLTELSGVFVNTETYASDLSHSDFMFKLTNRLGRILGPARLIASDKLEAKLRNLYDKEVAWHQYRYDNLTNPEDTREYENELAEAATATRIDVEQEMRNELKC